MDITIIVIAILAVWYFGGLINKSAEATEELLSSEIDSLLLGQEIRHRKDNKKIATELKDLKGVKSSADLLAELKGK